MKSCGMKSCTWLYEGPENTFVMDMKKIRDVGELYAHTVDNMEL